MLERQARKAFGLVGFHGGGAQGGAHIDQGGDEKRDDGEDELPVFVNDAVEHGWDGLRLEISSE